MHRQRIYDTSLKNVQCVLAKLPNIILRFTEQRIQEGRAQIICVQGHWWWWMEHNSFYLKYPIHPPVGHIWSKFVD